MWEPLTHLHLVKRARKSHRCQLCDYDIPAGSSYFTATGLWESDIHVYKAHVICQYMYRSEVWEEERTWDESTPEQGAFRDVLAHVKWMGHDTVVMLPGFNEGDQWNCQPGHEEPCLRCGQ